MFRLAVCYIMLELRLQFEQNPMIELNFNDPVAEELPHYLETLGR